MLEHGGNWNGLRTPAGGVPENVCHLDRKQIGCNERHVSALHEFERGCASLFPDKPKGSDACVDDEPPHRRPSCTAATTSNPLGAGLRRCISLANATNVRRLSCAAVESTSRTSASRERPAALARRLKASTTASSRFRTMICAMIAHDIIYAPLRLASAGRSRLFDVIVQHVTLASIVHSIRSQSVRQQEIGSDTRSLGIIVLRVDYGTRLLRRYRG
jgi:hypothetical protein